jgi:DNA replication protein
MNSKDQERLRQQQSIVLGMRSGVVSVPYALLKGYKQLKLSELDVMIILQLMAFKDREHQFFPTLDELQARLTAPSNQVIPAIQRLIKAQFISIDEAVDPQSGMQYEKYNLQQLYIKLAELVLDEPMTTSKQHPLTPKLAETEDVGKDLYSIIEREFGRPLTPMEFETISGWIDKDRYHEEVILAALKEAVFAGKLNFRYIDRILLDWSRHQITSAEMAKTYSQQFRQSR